MPSLYEINGAMYALLNNDDSYMVDTETGEIIGITTLIEQVEIARNDKHEAIALFIKDLEADAKSIKEEEANLKARREAKEKKANKLREYLQNSMQQFGDAKLETSKVAISFRKSEAVNILNEALIPMEFKTKVEEVKINKSDIKNALKNGQIVEGAELQVKQNLQIK